MTTVAVGDPATITIYQGREFLVEFTAENPDGTPMNLTGYTAAGRVAVYAGGPLLATFETGLWDGASMDALDSTGAVWCRLDDAVTAGIKRSGVYDVKLTQPDGDTVYLVGGPVRLVPEVTP